MDAEFVSSWFQKRAITIDELTGHMDFALELLDLGISHGVPGLNVMRDRVELLCRFVYDSDAVALSAPSVDFRLETDCSSPPEAILLHFLSRSASIDIDRARPILKHDLEKHILAFVGVDIIMWQTLLGEITKRCRRDLGWCFIVLDTSKKDPRAEDGKLGALLESFVRECIFTTERNDQWSLITEIMQLHPRFLKTEPWIHIKDLADSAVILVRYHQLHTPYQLDIISKEMDAQKRLLVKLGRIPLMGRMDVVRRGSGMTSSFDISDEDGVQLLLDAMLKLQKLICREIPVEVIYEDFVHGLLACGRSDFFLFVRSLLFPESAISAHIGRRNKLHRPLTLEKAEALLLRAAREYFDNAESNDLQHVSLRLAMECLEIVPLDLFEPGADLVKRIQKERLFYEAACELCGYIPDLLPIQVRHQVDKIPLLRRAIQCSARLYKDVEWVQELALRILPEEISCQSDVQMELFEFMVEASIARGDYDHAVSLCLDHMKPMATMDKTKNAPLSSTSILRVVRCCYEVAKEEQYSDSDRRLQLIGQALMLVPDNIRGDGKDTIQVKQILEVWKKIEAGMSKSGGGANRRRTQHHDGGSPIARDPFFSRLPPLTSESVASARDYQVRTFQEAVDATPNPLLEVATGSEVDAGSEVVLRALEEDSFMGMVQWMLASPSVCLFQLVDVGANQLFIH